MKKLNSEQPDKRPNILWAFVVFNIDNEIYSNPIDSVTSFISISTTKQFIEQKITNREMYEADLFYHRILADSRFVTDDY